MSCHAAFPLIFLPHRFLVLCYLDSVSSCSYLYSLETTNLLYSFGFGPLQYCCVGPCDTGAEENTGVKKAGHVTLGAEEGWTCDTGS